MSETKVERKTLREWREELGLAQYELADLAGVNHAMVSRIERSEVTIHGAVGQKILTALKDLGIDESQVIKGRKPARDLVERSANWDEDGYAADAPKRTLADWRLRRELSQPDLAVLAGLTAQTISRYENGKMRKSWVTNKIKLAKALRIRMDKLIMPGDEVAPSDENPVENILRAELRGARRALKKAHDFLREDPHIAMRHLDRRDALLPEIERELKGL